MPTADNPTGARFRGFRSPNYTQVPDELFDELLVELSGAELKVLLYIIRRTFGFKRDSDNISLSQMLNGLRTQDGRSLDRGVGLSKKTLLLALRALRERGVIVAEWHQSADKGNEPTEYRLNVIGGDELGPPVDPVLPPDSDGPLGRGGEPHTGDGPEPETSSRQEEILSPPLGEKVHQGGGGESTPPLGEKVHQGVGVKSTPSPRGKKYTTQKTVLRQTVDRKTEPRSTLFDSSTLHINKGDTVTPGLTRAHDIYVQARRRGALPSLAADAAPPVPPPSGFVPPTTPPAPPPRDAVRDPGLQHARPRWTSPEIEAQIQRLSDEFHDGDHVKPNVGQAVRLWRASGLDEAAFADRLLEARSITKRRVVHKPADGEPGQLGLRNKMPYFFTVLRDLLGLQDR